MQKEVDLQGLTASVSLPQMLYKECEKKEGDDSAVCSFSLNYVVFDFHCLMRDGERYLLY